MVIFDAQLISRVEWLRQRPPEAVATPPIYMVFDLLRTGPHDLRREPLSPSRATTRPSPATIRSGMGGMYDELRDMCRNPEAYQEWKARLSAVAGVYLIVACKSGEQYVGSAHGEDGIRGRWMAYAASGHGGNILLKKLIQADPDYPQRFLFSILQVLPKTQTRDEVLRWEGHYQVKLGTRATGLNLARG